MRRIERNVARANEVITTLTNFARVPEPEAKPFVVEPCVHEALEDCALPDGVDVAIDFPTDLPPALADPGQIRIVLGNLIRNAVDAMPSGGRLTLTGAGSKMAWRSTVADTGVGIAPDDLGRVMEPLFSTKARGMGLGLALSRMILDRNQWQLARGQRTRQGKHVHGPAGSWPVRRRDAQMTEHASSILLVDDDEDICREHGGYLHRSGLRC